MRLDPLIETLNLLLADSAWAVLALLLRVLFLCGLAWMLLRPAPRAVTGKSKPRVDWRLRLLAAVCFAAIGVRQAQWQLMGRRNPEFVRFMQRYDRREFNPAHQVRAGRILDRKGRTLALSRVTDRGVRRVYPYGPIFSHALGYNHPVYGLAGVESAGRRQLLGAGLTSPRELAQLGAELLDRERHAEGPGLPTTLDLALQRRAVELMEGRRGAVLLMDVHTGELLVMVSHPAYDPNRLVDGLFSGAFPHTPLVNRAISGLYPPGSAFKILVAAAALEHGFQGTLPTPPEGFTTSPANPPIRDHDYYVFRERGDHWAGHGNIALGPALASSSNTFFAQLGIQTGADNLRRTAETAGITRRLDLWREPEPTLHTQSARLPALRDDRPYQTAQFSIGQGDLLLTPLHLTLLSAAVANQGRVPAPTLDPSQASRTLGQLCSPETADTLKWMMWRAVESGTGRGMRMAELPVAAKTGTAQTGAGRPSHSWFTGFAPVSEPRWAFCVLVEEGGYGSRAALPVARDLLRDAIREGWLP